MGRVTLCVSAPFWYRTLVLREEKRLFFFTPPPHCSSAPGPSDTHSPYLLRGKSSSKHGLREDFRREKLKEENDSLHL